MILVATNISQVPAFILAYRLTKPPATVTSHFRPAVEPFKSGVETSVKTADDESQVA